MPKPNTPLRWGIAMTVKEPPQLVLANVHYHLAHGAAEVHVFLDDPDDPVAAHLAGVDGVHLYRCDAAYWQASAIGSRPPRQTRRQSINATWVLKNAGLDWVVHLDADEFLFQHRPLADELAHFPATRGYLAIQVRERAFVGAQDQMFDGAFRVPFKGRPAFETPIFGELRPYLTNGLTGHSAGKAAVPAGQGHRISIHAPRDAQRQRIPPLHASSTVLLHFDGLTRLHWVAKMLRYQADGAKGLVGPHRMAQLSFLTEGCQTPADVGAFHDMLKGVEPADDQRLTALGLLEHLPFDVGSDARAAVTKAGLSLSAADFDAELRLREPELLAGY